MVLIILMKYQINGDTLIYLLFEGYVNMHNLLVKMYFYKETSTANTRIGGYSIPTQSV